MAGWVLVPGQARLLLFPLRYLSTTQSCQSLAFTTTTANPGGGRGSRFNDRDASSKVKLTLEHFVLRAKSIKLYRDFLRASRNIPNPEARRQTVDWLRDEHFEGATGLKYEYDIQRIRDLLMAGNVALKRICGPMELAAAVNPRFGSFPKLRGSRSPPM